MWTRAKEQTLTLHGAAFHQKHAWKPLPFWEIMKTTRYYWVHQSSKYNERSKKVFFRLSHFLLPFDMILNFKIPQIQPGMYQFTFDSGFLKRANR